MDLTRCKKGQTLGDIRHPYTPRLKFQGIPNAKIQQIETDPVITEDLPNGNPKGLGKSQGIEGGATNDKRDLLHHDLPVSEG
jgi:hypothetical protein